MSKNGPIKRLMTVYRNRTKNPVVSVIRLQGTITASRGWIIYMMNVCNNFIDSMKDRSPSISNL